MATARVVETSPGVTVEFQQLESLPCGCVSAAYVARGLDVALVSVEAKGPHCIFSDHSAGELLGLGDLLEMEREVAGHDAEEHFAG